MADLFRPACDLVLRIEGVLSTNAEDNGGVTKYGISLRFLQSIEMDLTGDGIVTEDDVRALTEPQAIALYKRHFWTAPGFDRLPWWAALPLFDFGVNSGPGTASRHFQSALVAATGAPLGIDGVIGERSRALLNGAKPRRVLGEFFRRRLDLFLGHEDWLEMGRGWTGRAHRVWTAALERP
jgi:lysozyme family protein